MGEVYTLGGSPYVGLKHDQLLTYLRSGARLKKPTLATDDEYNIMRSCWLEDPIARPNFTHLYHIFTEKTPENKNVCIDTTHIRIIDDKHEYEKLIENTASKRLPQDLFHKSFKRLTFFIKFIKILEK